MFPIAERADRDLDLVALDPAGARAALVWNVDGRSETELLDLRSGHVEPLPAAPGEVVTGLAFTRSGDGLLIGSEGPTVPPRLSHLGLDRPAEPTPLLAAEPPDAELVAPTLHTFRAEDGLVLSGLAVPAAQRRSARCPRCCGCTAARRPRSAPSTSRCSRRCAPPGWRCSRPTCAARAATGAASPPPTTSAAGSSRSPTCARR